MMQLEGLGKLKNSMTPSGFKNEFKRIKYRDNRTAASFN
jgi:hypothetical protein